MLMIYFLQLALSLTCSSFHRFFGEPGLLGCWDMSSAIQLAAYSLAILILHILLVQVLEVTQRGENGAFSGLS